MRTERTRVEYRAGQWLAGSDLAAQAAWSAELLDLHQARQHDTWGIAVGFDATREGGTLTVNPGLALDARGRDLLLSETRQLAIPPAGDWVAVAAFAEHVQPAECAPPGLPAESPLLGWRRPTSVRLGIEVPIVAVRRRAEGITLDSGVRRRAHGLVRPRIASGRVQRNSTAVAGTYGNWAMTVSTSAGGLSSPAPVYFVTLDQHPWGELVNFGDTKPPPIERRLAEWVGPFVAVEAAGPAGFLVRVSGDLGTWREGHYPEPGTNPVGLSWIGVDTAAPLPFHLLTRLAVLDSLLLHGGVL